MEYGCIGEHLTHSFSGQIHGQLQDYVYELKEIPQGQLAAFMEKRDFKAINVTLPYKQAVIPYLQEVDSTAAKIGAVNTVVNRKGRLYGYNTDFGGMIALIRRTGIDLKGKKVLILGTGGTSKTATAVAQAMGAGSVRKVSRRKSPGVLTYEEAVQNHQDAQVILNTTPVGMYPNCEDTPIDIACFPKLEGILDAVYNPLRTNLILDAQQRGIKAEGGLYMLVMQAVVAVEHFLDTSIPRETADRVFAEIFGTKENIVLTGMPGSGKSTVGKLLNVEGFSFVDTDAEVEKRCGCTIKDLIAAKGETYFRNLETEVIRELSASSGQIISTGGGAILREENVRYLNRNGKLYFLDARLERLQATDDRPLSDTVEKLKRLYAERIHIYRSTAQMTVPDLGDAAAEAQYILSKRKELIL